MLRLAAVLMSVTMATPVAAQVTGAIPPATPALKREVTVLSDLVRIGDLIDNAGTSARVPIFRAPDLGHTGTVSAVRVVEAVRAHGFAIVETRGVSDVAVTRASRVITVKDLQARIANALAGQPGLGEARNLSVTIERDARPVHLEPSATAELQPTRVFYDPRSGRFDVTFEVPDSGAARRASLRYVGTIVETAEAAVLTRPLKSGDVVKASDVLVERPKAEIRGDVAGSVADVVGLAARRPLRAGETVHAADLMKPDLVQRNEMVTLFYEVPGLVLTMRGKALDSGAQGDPVNVLNIQSKRTVQGTVSGPRQVTIAAPMPRMTTQLDPPPQSQPEGEQPREPK
ncbi:MAG TPA: flagellar basal body P-ring formation chaperone FlgA [Xanthobacteraceae bacterium]|nr:flagellar basal body P-ring formation chaperone FlgA [Xanthobacteraceae bacterium]